MRSDHATAMPAPRVGIVGMGMVTPLGTTPSECWQSLMCGSSGTRFVTGHGRGGLGWPVAAEIPGPGLPAGDADGACPSRGVALVLQAARGLLQSVGTIPAETPTGRRGLCVGGGYGDWHEDRIAAALDTALSLLADAPVSTADPDMLFALLSPTSIPLAGEELSRLFAHSGPTTLLYGASASGAQAIVEGAEMIREGRAELILVAGYDAMANPVALRALDRLGLLSSRRDDPALASRPFDRTRDGWVMGEGAGALLLETLASAEARHAVVHAEILGWAMSNSAAGAISPPADGAGMVIAMRRALASAGVGPGQIDYICAYGNSSVLFDAAETRAIRTVFSDLADRIPVSSTKGAMGYLAAASGPVDVIVSTLALAHGVIPPTINYQFRDPLCDLDYVPNTSRSRSLQRVMINSSGLGGQHVTLILGQPPRGGRAGSREAEDAGGPGN